MPGWPRIHAAMSPLLPRGSPLGDRAVAIAFVTAGGLATAAIAAAVIGLRADLAKWPAVQCTVVVSAEGFGTAGRARSSASIGPACGTHTTTPAARIARIDIQCPLSRS